MRGDRLYPIRIFWHYPSRSGLRGGAAGVRADSARSPAAPSESARSPAERRQNIFQMDSKLFWRTPADSERTPADSKRTLKSAADCGQMKRSLVINLNHYPHNVNSVQL